MDQAGGAGPTRRCLSAGDRTLDIGPALATKGHWDQRDNSGQQVAPGWYEIGYEFAIIETDTGKRYTANPTTRFQIVDPSSAMNKNLEVNRSVTADGLTVTLERIEMDAVKGKVYLFTTPPGYSVPQSGALEQSGSFVMQSAAAYSVDGGIIKQPSDVQAQFNEKGAWLIWNIDPIPVDATEMTFVVVRLGGTVGRWEFRIPLE